jgi:hypothetical protein
VKRKRKSPWAVYFYLLMVPPVRSYWGKTELKKMCMDFFFLPFLKLFYSCFRNGGLKKMYLSARWRWSESPVLVEERIL